MNTTITLEDILTTLADMEYVSDESLEKFQQHIEQHGIDDETLRIFSELLNEELAERDAEISAGEEMTQALNTEIQR